MPISSMTKSERNYRCQHDAQRNVIRSREDDDGVMVTLGYSPTVVGGIEG